MTTTTEAATTETSAGTSTSLRTLAARMGAGRMITGSLVVFGLLLGACGDNADEVIAGSGGEETAQTGGSQSGEPETGGPETEGQPGTPGGPDDGDDGGADLPVEDGRTRTTSSPELVSAQKAAISEVAVLDDNTIGVRFEGAAEPCSLANVTVTETDSSITVLLETGLNPNAAAMTCIAQVFNYEIPVTLDQPVGDREIILDTP